MVFYLAPDRGECGSNEGISLSDAPAFSPKPIGKLFDLSYINRLGHQERRAAAFYEYSRHCAALIELIQTMRDERFFDGQPGSPELNKQFMQLVLSGIFRGDELVMLAICGSFPERPFTESTQYRKIFGSSTQCFGIRPPCFLPWPAVDAIRKKQQKVGFLPEDVLHDSNMHVVSIPWESYNDSEIIEMLTERVPNLRPQGVPEPKKSGRGGRTKSLGTLDMIHQLAAYRQYAAGHNFQMGSPLCLNAKGERLFGSSEGWDKAIETAKSRITRIMYEPFFSV